MELESKIIGFDGSDKIIFSQTYILYENELTIPNLLGFKFKFIFEKTDPKSDQRDVEVKPLEGKDMLVTFSKKFRNKLGSITSEKLVVLINKDGGKVLLSVFGHEAANNCLHITVNFYLR